MKQTMPMWLNTQSIRIISMRLNLLIILLIIPMIQGYSQAWKQYPYEPEGGVFSFPSDEGRHPDEAVEWWYIAGHLEGLETGTSYSFMLTYFAYPFLGYEGFRILNLCNDDTGEFYDETQPLTFLELGMDHLNIGASLLTGTFEYWRLRRDSADHLIPFEYDISAASANGSLNLSCASLKPPIFLGDSGLFDQGTESYTYYYSQTMNEVSGTLSFRDKTEEVKGTAWIDRQFGGFNQVTGERYEWFFVQLSNGMDLNIWNIFTGDNQLPDTSTFKHLTLSDDTARHFTTTDFNFERLSYHYMPDSLMCYAQQWHLTSMVNQVDLYITTLHHNTEVRFPFRFYEGSTRITGTVNGLQVTGRGFAELLKTYENPLLGINAHPDETVYGAIPVSWHLNNPDEGRPLFYDLDYSLDNFETALTVRSGISDTLFTWEDPPLANGDSCWFRVRGYSVDTTLFSDSPVSGPVLYAPENTGAVDYELNHNGISAFIVFPNPANHLLNLEFARDPHFFSYQVCDLSGRIILGSYQTIQGKTATIPIDQLKAGSYIIRIQVDSVKSSALFQVYD